MPTHRAPSQKQRLPQRRRLGFAAALLGRDRSNCESGSEKCQRGGAIARLLLLCEQPFQTAFLHHLVDGSNRNQRGGKEAAPFWEWGGKGLSGEDEFDRHRPGWGKPIHQMLVDHGASVVFHGHDHMFIKQDLDGIVYQLVPQPGHPRSGTKSAEEYGYISGEVQGSSGHVRVRVSGDSARVDYVRAYLPTAEGGSRRNGDVSYSYAVQGKEITQRRKAATERVRK